MDQENLIRDLIERVQLLENDNKIMHVKYRQLEEKVMQLLCERESRMRKRGMHLETEENDGMGIKRTRTSSDVIHNQSSLDQTNSSQTVEEVIKRELDCDVNDGVFTLKEPKKEVDEDGGILSPRNSPVASNISTQDNDSEIRSRGVNAENRMRHVQPITNVNTHPMVGALLRGNPSLAVDQRATAEDWQELAKAFRINRNFIRSRDKNVNKPTKHLFEKVVQCEICRKKINTEQTFILHATGMKHRAKLGDFVPREAVHFWTDKCSAGN